MKRRAYLVTTISIVMGLSGCSTNSNSSENSTPAKETGSGNELDAVELVAEDSDSDSPFASLSIKYNQTVSEKIPTDPPTIANEGMKWLFVKMEITNTGTESHELTGGPFIIEIEGDTYGIVSTKQDWSLRGRKLAPNNTTTGWFVFQIPEKATQATLSIRQDITREYSVKFEKGENLDTSLPGP